MGVFYNIRPMKREDAHILHCAFSRQGDDKSLDLLLSYYSDQQRGDRKVFIAEYENEILGYITLLRNSKLGPYKDKYIPQIDDLSVLKPYQQHGLGAYLINVAEKTAVKFSEQICVAIPFTATCDISQNMFSKRDYKLQGTGIWSLDSRVSDGESIILNDDIKVYLIKSLEGILK